VVYTVEWNPNTDLSLFAVATKSFLYVVYPKRITCVPK